MDWLLLILAGLFGVVGVIGIKRTAEKNIWTNNIILIAGFVISFQLLVNAMETIPLSTAATYSHCKLKCIGENMGYFLW